MKVKTRKCHFALKEVKYLGHIVTPEGIKPDSEAVQAISDLKGPQDGYKIPSISGGEWILQKIYRRLL